MAALRQAGASVYIIGLPVDLVVGYQARTLLMECKSLTGKRKPRAARYTALQRDFMAGWLGGPISTVTGWRRGGGPCHPGRN